MINFLEKSKKHCYMTVLPRTTSNCWSLVLENLANLYNNGTTKMAYCYIAVKSTSQKSKNNYLQRHIVQMHHDIPSARHPGRWKSYELVSHNYWWLGMSIFPKTYVMGCNTCQRMKNCPQQPYGLLQPNPVPKGPWEIIITDLITQLPESDGYTAICGLL